MLTFSYTITPSLKKEIERIDEIRDKIMVQLLPRKEELQLRWETNLDRATQASRLTANKLKRQEILDALQDGRNRHVDAISYIKTSEWINQNWYLSTARLTVRDVKKIFSFFSERKNVDDKLLNDSLEFIQVNPEHPIVQAGLSFFLIFQTLNSADNIKLSIILSQVFMYKAGYDFRGMANIEEFLTSDIEHLKDLLDAAEKEKNLSSFLEYYTAAIAISSEHALRKVTERNFKHDLPSSFYDLTERQKEIMGLFTKPGIKVTNKTVQREFKVSQITASRDLAKLHTLGLIFSGGKGRSVYYTRM